MGGGRENCGSPLYTRASTRYHCPPPHTTTTFYVVSSSVASRARGRVGRRGKVEEPERKRNKMSNAPGAKNALSHQDNVPRPVLVELLGKGARLADGLDELPNRFRIERLTSPTNKNLVPRQVAAPLIEHLIDPRLGPGLSPPLHEGASASGGRPREACPTAAPRCLTAAWTSRRELSGPLELKPRLVKQLPLDCRVRLLV